MRAVRATTAGALVTAHIVPTQGRLSRPAKKVRVYLQRRWRQQFPRRVPAAVAAAHAALVAEGGTLPGSAGSRYYAQLPVRIGVVSDEVLLTALVDTAALVPLTPTDAATAAIDVFLFVACWQGGGTWPRIGVPGSPSRLALLAALDALEARGIPTVFWSIEDPPHYRDFLEVAQRCRYVYTTAAELVPTYQRDCPGRTVDVWPFAINPRVHHPLGTGRSRRAGLFFAGSWYRQYPEREVDMANVFDGVVGAGRDLVFVDRCYLRGNPSFDVPAAYQRFTLPPIDHATLQQVQKRFDWCLNFSSVKHSPTMLANRVPELLAQGAAVVSNYSRAVDLHYPEVFTVTTSAQVGAIVDGLSGADLRAHQQLGVRGRFEGGSYVEAIARVLTAAGHAVDVPRPRVLVVADEVTEAVRAALATQTLTEPVTLMDLAALTPAALAGHDFVARWSAAPEVGPFHLQDQLHAFKYTQARYVRTGASAHDYTDELPDVRGVMFAASEFTLAELRGAASGEGARVPGGYVVPDVRARTPVPPDARPARLEVVVSLARGQAVRIWSKWFLPARRGAGRPAVDMLIVDDGSADATDRAWLARMAEHPGVRVVTSAAGAWSAAAAHAQAPLVLVGDADDQLVPGAVARLVPALRELASDRAAVCTDALDLAAPSRRSPPGPLAPVALEPAAVLPVAMRGVVVATAALRAAGGDLAALRQLGLVAQRAPLGLVAHYAGAPSAKPEAPPP